MPFIPHTAQEVAAMLETCGAATIHQLFDEIPAAHQAAKSKIKLPAAMSEQELSAHMQELSNKNLPATCFIGGHFYDHAIPSAVWQTASRGEFYSAYTPYQAEVSQGTLQTIFEFQTMITELTAMEASNASMYDGASACSEAILMACRSNPNAKRIVVYPGLHPSYLETAHALTGNQDITIEPIHSGSDLTQALQKPTTAVVVQFPNYFGSLDNVHEITNLAHANNALVIAVVNPMALATLTPPGQWGDKGADIACGNGQPLGLPLCAGGPSYGFLTTRLSMVRQMPGRIVGKTNDTNNKEGYVLTLQAREQHIRRSKATSNICTNQGLAVTASTIYLSLVGSDGLDATFTKSVLNTRALTDGLAKIRGIAKPLSGTVSYDELITLPIPAPTFIKGMAKHNILAGSIPPPELYPALSKLVGAANCKRSIIVSATEKRTPQEIDEYLKIARKVIKT